MMVSGMNVDVSANMSMDDVSASMSMDDVSASMSSNDVSASMSSNDVSVSMSSNDVSASNPLFDDFSRSFSTLVMSNTSFQDRTPIMTS